MLDLDSGGGVPGGVYEQTGEVSLEAVEVVEHEKVVPVGASVELIKSEDPKEFDVVFKSKFETVADVIGKVNDKAVLVAVQASIAALGGARVVAGLTKKGMGAEEQNGTILSEASVEDSENKESNGFVENIGRVAGGLGGPDEKPGKMAAPEVCIGEEGWLDDRKKFELASILFSTSSASIVSFDSFKSSYFKDSLFSVERSSSPSFLISFLCLCLATFSSSSSFFRLSLVNFKSSTTFSLESTSDLGFDLFSINFFLMVICMEKAFSLRM